MINRQALVLFVLASIFGLGAAVYANNWVQNQLGNNMNNASIESDLAIVIVAAREIPYGNVIEDIHLREAKWPKDLAPAMSFQDTSLVLGKIANQKILSGEPIFSPRIVEKLDGSTLSAMIEPNKRAITVRVNDVIGVGGFLLPGNRVDVLATRVIKGRANTSTVLQNLKVLAVDQTASQDKDQPVVVRAVTLEAGLDESVELVKATEEGTVQLVLRNPVDAKKLKSKKKPSIRAVTIPKRKIRRSTSITVIRGVEIKKTNVKISQFMRIEQMIITGCILVFLFE